MKSLPDISTINLQGTACGLGFYAVVRKTFVVQSSAREGLATILDAYPDDTFLYSWMQNAGINARL